MVSPAEGRKSGKQEDEWIRGDACKRFTQAAKWKLSRVRKFIMPCSYLPTTKNLIENLSSMGACQLPISLTSGVNRKRRR
jgi:hypothetical protein